MYFAALSALLGGLSAGLVMGYTSPALASMSRVDSVPRIVKQDIKSWISSLAAAGALIGALFAGPICSKFGRRPSLIFNNLTMIIGWSFIIFSKSVWSVIAGRVVTGIAAGFMSGCVPLYLLEICPVSVRGFFGSGFQLANVTGILLVNIMGVFLNWKYLAIGCCVPPVIMPFLMAMVPETPIYLMNKFGDCKETLSSLRKMRRQKDITDEFEELKNQPKDKQPMILGVRELRDPLVYTPLLLSLGLFVFQQFSGITAIMFYQADIFRQSGSALNANLCAVITNFIQVVATLIAAFVVDKFGRKLLLYASSTGHVISLTLLSIYFWKKDDPTFASQFGWLSLVSLSIFLIAYSVGFGPIPWMMGSEMTPFSARSFVAAVSGSFNWSLGFLIANQFKTLQWVLGLPGTYGLFAAMSFISLLFVKFCLPETSGKTLEEVQKNFQKSSKSDQVSHV
ncbi:Facilitated trehalose transporter Tret1-like protein [Dinothrombium tinctorium]|nr:Facilitated trehalose transporter Tret1-like protein [Dinothrombium tinctorium]RWS11721.1 Facilitated trehalose transporter Tret1-like protein [Dinothrombium tinctorium]